MRKETAGCRMICCTARLVGEFVVRQHVAISDIGAGIVTVTVAALSWNKSRRSRKSSWTCLQSQEHPGYDHGRRQGVPD